MTLSYHDIISWYDNVITHHSRTVVYQSKLWWSMVYHGNTMVYHGVLCYTMTPWFTMVYHGIPW